MNDESCAEMLENVIFGEKQRANGNQWDDREMLTAKRIMRAPSALGNCEVKLACDIDSIM